MGILLFSRGKDAGPQRETKPDGTGRGFCKNKSLEWRNRPVLAAPRSPGLKADPAFSARPVRTLSRHRHAEATEVLWFFLFKNVLQADPTTYALTAGSAEGEMRACSGNFLTSVNFSQDLAMSQCDAQWYMVWLVATPPPFGTPGEVFPCWVMEDENP